MLLHPEIGKGLYQNNFLLFDKLDLRGGSSRYFSVYDDDLVTHISSLEEMKTRFMLENEKIKEMAAFDLKREKEKEEENEDSSEEESIDSEEERNKRPNLGDLDNSKEEVLTDHLVHDRSHAFSDPSEF